MHIHNQYYYLRLEIRDLAPIAIGNFGDRVADAVNPSSIMLNHKMFGQVAIKWALISASPSLQ